MHLVSALLTILLTLSRVGATSSRAAEMPPCSFPATETQLSIYLLTMDPGGEVFNNFGHSGLYVRDPEHDTDLVYNFGAFESSDPDVLTKFLKGNLPFWLATRNRRSMLELYATENRSVIASRLLLSREQLDMLALNLQFLSKPKNRAYSYHWYSANCSTRIRDLLDKVTGREISAQRQGSRGVTARGELLRHAGNNLVFWFAQSWALATDADREITEWEEMFLPANLRTQLLATQIRGPSGEPQALLGEECLLRQGTHPPPMEAAPSWSPYLWLAGLCLSALLLAEGAGARRTPVRVLFGLTLVAMGLFSGALGTASAALWIFDGLDVYQRNENLFLANPLSLLLALAGVGVALGGPCRAAFARFVSLALALISFAGVLFGVVRGLPQSNLGMIGFFFPPLVAAVFAIWRMSRPGVVEPHGQP